MTNNGDRSVKGNITGAAINTGDNSVVEANVRVEGTTSPAADIDLVEELAALRKLLLDLDPALDTPNALEMERALQEAEKEAAAEEPDKDEIGRAIKRWFEYAKIANNFIEHAEKILQRLAILAAWAGFSL